MQGPSSEGGGLPGPRWHPRPGERCRELASGWEELGTGSTQALGWRVWGAGWVCVCSSAPSLLFSVTGAAVDLHLLLRVADEPLPSSVQRVRACVCSCLRLFAG